MNNHTFIYEEGEWTAAGIYFDSGENMFSVEGKIDVKHQSNLWTAQHTLNLLGDEKKIIEVKDEISPPKNDKAIVFIKTDPELGKLNGKIIFSDDNLISVYESENKEITGTEYLKKVGDNHYKNRGVLFINKIKHASWSLELNRIEK